MPCRVSVSQQSNGGRSVGRSVVEQRGPGLDPNEDPYYYLAEIRDATCLRGDAARAGRVPKRWFFLAAGVFGSSSQDRPDSLEIVGGDRCTHCVRTLYVHRPKAAIGTDQIFSAPQDRFTDSRAASADSRMPSGPRRILHCMHCMYVWMYVGMSTTK